MLVKREFVGSVGNGNLSFLHGGMGGVGCGTALLEALLRSDAEGSCHVQCTIQERWHNRGRSMIRFLCLTPYMAGQSTCKEIEAKDVVTCPRPCRLCFFSLVDT